MRADWNALATAYAELEKAVLQALESASSTDFRSPEWPEKAMQAATAISRTASNLRSLAVEAFVAAEVERGDAEVRLWADGYYHVEGGSFSAKLGAGPGVSYATLHGVIEAHESDLPRRQVPNRGR